MKSTQFSTALASCAAVLAALGTTPAQAAYVEYSASIAEQALPFSTNFSVQKFDSNLGTLTGVLLTLGSSITAQVDVWSNLSAPANFSNAFASFPVTVTAQSPDATSVTANPVATLASGTALPSMPGGYINQFPGLTGTATANTLVAASQWLYYVGSGVGLASFTATAGAGSYGGTGPFGLFFSGSGKADGLFTVRYDYELLPTAVPVPPSLGLLDAALAVLGLFMRRRTQAAVQSLGSSA